MASCGNAISTVGCELFIDDETEGTADVQIKGHTAISFSGLEATEIETTAICDTEKQFMNGLLDLGSCTVSINPDYGDDGQNLVRENLGGAVVKTFQLVLPNDDAIDFTAIVRTGSTDLGIDTKVEGSFDLRLKSRPTVTPSGGTEANF